MDKDDAGARVLAMLGDSVTTNRISPAGNTIHIPNGEKFAIYDAAMRYQAAGTLLVVIAGQKYCTGSSRDWAAKGTDLLGVKAVIAESFERIHLFNPVGMGVPPLQFKLDQNRNGSTSPARKPSTSSA